MNHPYQLFLLAGMRHRNLSKCRWEWVDLNAQWILIPKAHHKTGKKSKRALQVLLSTHAVRLLQRLKALQEADPATKGSPWLFPRPGDKTRSRDDLQDPWARLTGQKAKPDRRRKAPVKVVSPLFGCGEDKEVHIHDLRRTLASVLSDLGFKSYVGQILGHATQGVTEVYTRTSAGPLLAMVEQAGSRIVKFLGLTGDTTLGSAPCPSLPCPALVPQPISYLLNSNPTTFISSFKIS